MALDEYLRRLASFDAVPYPVISLYLNARPDQQGKDHFQTFVRKEMKARASTYADRADRDSLDHDLERISQFLETGLQPSANGVAIFACDAAKLFETVQLDAPLDDHWLYIGDRPHLYPLARLASQNPLYAVVLADTFRTRILVVAGGSAASDTVITGVKTRWTHQGGTSQPRYQRHIQNYHLHHVKEVVEVLDGIVAKDRINQIVISGDPVVLPLLREQLPKHLAAKVINEISLRPDVPEREAITHTQESLRLADAQSDRKKVDEAVGAYRAGGLGVVGPDATLLALTNGQVDELLITASLANLGALGRTSAGEMAVANDAGVVAPAIEETSAGEPARVPIATVRLSDDLIQKAEQTQARVWFIEDASLLKPYGGVAATLRYRG